jgi:hypothetical protein
MTTHIRLIEPQGVFNAIAAGRDGLDADLKMILAVCQVAKPPPCFLCEQELLEPPSVIGWVDTAQGRAAFLICEDCGEPGVEELIFAKLGFEPMAWARLNLSKARSQAGRPRPPPPRARRLPPSASGNGWCAVGWRRR